MPTPFPVGATSINSTFPERPRLVLRAGFAGIRELNDGDESRIRHALQEVFRVLGHELAAIAPYVPVGLENKPRIAHFFSVKPDKCPLLRVVTGLDKGSDLLAGDVLRSVRVLPDQDANASDERRNAPCLETELAAVVPYDVHKYRSTRDFKPEQYPANKYESPAEFDRQVSECQWILELDGVHDKPTDAELAAMNESAQKDAKALGKQRRSRGYRAQAAFILRQSDIFIAAADPDGVRKAGGTLETVREAQVFELPVVFINSTNGAISLVAPEDDLNSVLAEPVKNTGSWEEMLRRWIRQLVAGAEHLSSDVSDPHDDPGEHGVELLTEFFDRKHSPAYDEARWTRRTRKRAWVWFEGRFRNKPGKSNGGKVEMLPFDAFRDRASRLSGHYSGLYRGAFVINYFLAIIAVSLAALSLVLFSTLEHQPLEQRVHEVLVSNGLDPEKVAINPHLALKLLIILLVVAATKFIIVRLIAHNTRCANSNKWNDRAVDFRYLAERLRTMYYLPQIGSQQPPAAGPPQFATRVVRQSAMDWLFEAIVRAASPADLVIKRTDAGASEPRAESLAETRTIPSHQAGLPDITLSNIITIRPLVAAQSVRDSWIRDQINYHDRNARTMTSMDHAIETLSVVLSNIVPVFVALDAAIVVAEIFHKIPEGWAHTFTVFALILVAFSAVLPAIVAALGGVRFQSESRRLAERSSVMRSMLSGWHGGHTAHEQPKGRWNIIRTNARNFWHVLRLLWDDNRPDQVEIQTPGGRFAMVDTLIKRIERETAVPATNVGSWSHDLLRMTELVARDFVQEAAEWSVLYAREVSDPG